MRNLAEQVPPLPGARRTHALCGARFVARTRGRGLEEPAAVARRAGRRMEMMTVFSATVGAVREAAAE